MEKSEQKEVAESLINNLRDTVLARIDLFPDNWNGIEIRQYILDLYEEKFICYSCMDQKTKRNYRNDLNVRPGLL